MNKVILIEDKLTNKDGTRIVTKIAEASCDENVENIVLLINSGGGTTTILENIYRVVDKSNKPIVSIGMHMVGSAAAAIFMMPKRRILFPNTRFLVHEASFCCNENDQLYERNLKRMLKDIKRETDLLVKPVIMRATILEKTLRRKIAKGDWWLTEEEIEKFGIVTEKYDVEVVNKLLGEIK